GLKEQNELQLKEDNKVASKTLKLCKVSDENPIMIGTYGPYVVGKEQELISLPPTWIPGNVTDEDIKALIAEGKQRHEPKVLGTGARNGDDVQLLVGRFGPYWQEGTGKDAKRASVPKWVTEAEKMEDLEIARRYLSLPRVLGVDDEG